MKDDYRKVQIDWVSGLKGTNPYEVLLVSLLSSISPLILLKIINNHNFILEWAFLVIPIIGLQCFDEIFIPLFIIVDIILIGFFSVDKKSPYNLRKKKYETTNKIPLSSLRSIISCFRSLLMISTCVGILAVDFPIFPRRFAKTEIFGFSVMDIGVGMFVLSSALVAGKLNLNHKSYSLSKSLRATFPIILLGSTRFVTVKVTEYQEHLSEYGVHWNFFLTMAFLVFFSAPFAYSSYRSYFAVVIMSIYQYFLVFPNVIEYLLESPRNNIISANREGLLSLLGYFSLYLIGMDLGVWLRTPTKSLKDSWRKTFKLFILGIIFWIFMIISENYIQNSCRRFANLSYCMFVLAIFSWSSMLMLGFLCFLKGEYTLPNILNSVNRNQLAIFLVSNLLTGLINLSMKTIYASTFKSIVVMLCYTFAFLLFATILNKRNITLKF